QPPRVALVGGGSTPSIVVVWTAKAASGTALLSARSSDGGRSFGASEPVPGSDAAGNRGWESIAVDSATGRVYAVWLDHRDAASQAGGAHAAHQHGAAAPSERSDPSCSWVPSAPSCRRAASRAASATAARPRRSPRRTAPSTSRGG